MDGSIVMAWRPPSSGGSESARLVSVDIDATKHAVLPFEESDAECWRAQEVRPFRLPDDRLGFLRECQPREFRESDMSVTWHRVWALDMTNGSRELLADLGDPWVHDGRRILYFFSYAPDLAEGAVYMGNRICDGVASFDGSGVRPLEFALGLGPNAPNLDEPFRQDCEETINARDPVWSPDGSRLAVLVSIDAKGRDGFARFDLEWDLVILDPASGAFEILESGLADPHSLAWSPDGQWMVLGTDDRARSSSWLVGVEGGNGTIERLDIAERISSFDWSADSRSVVGLVDATANGDLADFAAVPVIIDLKDAVAGNATID